MTVALIGPLGLPELLIILFILILLFGAKRLSGLGRGLGQGIRDFKREMKDQGDDEDRPAASRTEDGASAAPRSDAR